MGISIVPMVMMNSCASSGKAALVDSYLLVNNTFVMAGFVLGFIFLSPPFSPIRFFLCHFLELRARFCPFIAQKEPGLGAFFAKNVFCL